jgi:multicomponent K+:H+ antiporter subunit E
MRLLPAPLLSTMLFFCWLALTGSASIGQLLLAGLLAWAIPLATGRLLPERVHIQSWVTVFRLSLVVLYDIVAAALTVARQILGPEDRLLPGFATIPLSIRDPYGITSLASIITMTPGTLSVDVSADRTRLLVHALNLDDPAALVASIKSRYERPLIAIFEGK